MDEKIIHSNLSFESKSKSFSVYSFNILHSSIEIVDKAFIHITHMIWESVCIYFCIHNTISIWRVTPPTVKKSNSLVTFVFHAWYCIWSMCWRACAPIFTLTHSLTHTQRLHANHSWISFLSHIDLYASRSKRDEAWMVCDQSSAERSTEHTTIILYALISFVRSFKWTNKISKRHFFFFGFWPKNFFWAKFFLFV